MTLLASRPSGLGRALLALLLGLAAGCGDALPWQRSDANGDKKPPALQRQAERIARDKGTPGKRAPLAPVETFLADGVTLPERVGGTSLTLALKSNVPGARFECRTQGAGSFKACEARSESGQPLAAAMTFGPLVSGTSYGATIRACAPDGRCDDTPLAISFLADRAAPSPAPPPPTEEPGDAGDDPSLPAAGGSGPRTLQIGSAVTLAAPPAFTVTSYATTKTTNTTLYQARRTGVHAGSAYKDEPCTRSYEVLQTGADGIAYCVGTPSRNELAATYGARALPWNHAEMVRGAGPVTEEKLLVAAFDAEGDPTDGRLTIDTTCARATLRGTLSVPVLPDFFGAAVRREPFAWCHVQDNKGVWWWVGTFTARLTPEDPQSQRVTVVYSAAASLGLTSAQMFAVRARDQMTMLLAPLAP